MVNGVWTPTSDTLASKTALAAIDPTERVDGDIVVLVDGSKWIFSTAATATDAASQLIVTPGTGPGQWLNIDDGVDLTFPIAFGTADAAVLYTVPTGCRLHVRRGYWEVATGFTGGSSSAIGLSSSNAAYNTKGDLLGGAGGDVAATLVAGIIPGTIGAKTAAGVILVAGNTVRFDRITSAFTAGAGFAHLIADVLTNPGV
jgi:hypothetical protein